MFIRIFERAWGLGAISNRFNLDRFASSLRTHVCVRFSIKEKEKEEEILGESRKKFTSRSNNIASIVALRLKQVAGLPSRSRKFA